MTRGPDRSATSLTLLAEALRSQISRRVPAIGWVPRVRPSKAGSRCAGRVHGRGIGRSQALGYAAIAGVPVELGLYAVPFALIAYAVFGSSRQLVVGPVSTVSVLSGSLVAALRPEDVWQAVLFTTGAALWAGIVLIVARNSGSAG